MFSKMVAFMTLSIGLILSIEVKQSHISITHSIAPIILYLLRITRSCNPSTSFHAFVTMCVYCVVFDFRIKCEFFNITSFALGFCDSFTQLQLKRYGNTSIAISVGAS